MLNLGKVAAGRLELCVEESGEIINALVVRLVQ